MQLKEGQSEDNKWFKQIPKGLGISLLIVGMYYFLVRVAIPIIDPYISINLMYFVHVYLQPILGSIILIVGGYMILRLNKNTKPVSER
ncbi:putative Mn2+ efflux pump MntP [Evansella vedderi]|uniref:Mn2+ efflux pump MntP n=1 Tax=Evansella vedderi TaxID=38282 RepID=A0ABU0A1S4_9BACI|nr:hypothetical protein [Evansella vedderi]MDQ0257049.1 putative Mn2+ efflux pump MntP [Evansella vedderi]